MKEVGLWIDHHKAIIVIIKEESDVTLEIRSNVEKKIQVSGLKEAKVRKTAQGSTPEDPLDRQFGEHLGRYYEGVISFIRDAGSIWIIGPGEAKTELENCLKREELNGRIVGIETMEKFNGPPNHDQGSGTLSTMAKWLILNAPIREI